MISKLTEKKSLGKALTMEDYYLAVDYILNHGVNGKAVKFFLSLNSFGMSKKEVYYLAIAMRDSGRVLTFNQSVFEKHSTGGVGDSTSVVLIPLIASLGYRIIKTTAKSLVFTNGSSDRFGAIPGFNVKLTDKEIKQVIDKTNACILSHNGEVCPADRLFFEFLESYGLTSNINFLASSIASKKLASGARMVLVDVKYGYGSVIKKYSNAKKLAKLLKYIFKQQGVKCTIVITNTVQTIGDGIGNSLEVADAVEILRGKKCLAREIVTKFAIEMISSVNKKISKSEIREMIDIALDNGFAYNYFLQLVKSQGGSVDAIEKNKLFKPYHEVNFVAIKNGYVGNINSMALGDITRRLCSLTHNNNIGFRIYVKIGDIVHVGDRVLTFYYKDKLDLVRFQDLIAQTVNLTEVKIRPCKVIRRVIR